MEEHDKSETSVSTDYIYKHGKPSTELTHTFKCLQCGKCCKYPISNNVLFAPYSISYMSSCDPSFLQEIFDQGLLYAGLGPESGVPLIECVKNLAFCPFLFFTWTPDTKLLSKDLLHNLEDSSVQQNVETIIHGLIPVLEERRKVSETNIANFHITELPGYIYSIFEETDLQGNEEILDRLVIIFLDYLTDVCVETKGKLQLKCYIWKARPNRCRIYPFGRVTEDPLNPKARDWVILTYDACPESSYSIGISQTAHSYFQEQNVISHETDFFLFLAQYFQDNKEILEFLENSNDFNQLLFDNIYLKSKFISNPNSFYESLKKHIKIILDEYKSELHNKNY